MGIQGAMLNPANFPVQHDYHIAGFFEETELENRGFRTDLSGAVLDRNPEAFFPALLSYRESELRGQGGYKREDTEIQVSVGKPYGEWMSLGISATYLKQEISDAEEMYLNGSVGLLFKPLKSLGFGFVAENIFNNHTVGLEPLISVAGAYNFQNLALVALDITLPQKGNPERDAIVSLGVETRLLYGFTLRFGYRADTTVEESFYSGGLGWLGPRLAASYALEKNVDRGGEFTHSFDLSVYF